MGKLKKGFAQFCKAMRRDVLLTAMVALEVLLLLEQIISWGAASSTATLLAGDGLNAYSGGAVQTEQGIENAPDETGTFGSTRWLSLHGGLYTLKVTYQAEENADSYMSVYDALAISNDSCTLPAGETTASLAVWVPQKTETFQVHFVVNAGSICIQKLEVIPRNNNAVLLRLAVIFAVADFLYLLLRRRIFRAQPRVAATILCLGAVALFASMPLFSNQLLGSDDIFFHLHRIEGLADEMRLGTALPVYLQSDWFGGQGYPVSVFYCDLFLYFPALLRVIGFPLQTAFQIYLATINALTAFTVWWAMKKILHTDAAAILASALFTLAPYRLVNLYRRAALGEFTAMAFIPLIVAGLWDVFTLDTEDARYHRCWVPVAIGFWGVLQSHLISTEMCAMFTLALCLIFLRRTLRRKTFAALCKAAGTAALASVWYLLPLVDYMRRGGFMVTRQDAYWDIQNAGSFLGQLMQVFANGGGTGQNVHNGLKGDMLQTPGAALLLALFAFLLLLALRKEETLELTTPWRTAKMSFGCAAAALVLCLWTTPWNLLRTIPLLGKLAATVQFPWRFLGVACLFLAMLAAALQEILRPKKEWRIACVCVLAVCCLLESGYAMSSCADTAEVIHIGDISGMDTYNCGNGEYLPEGFDTDNKDYYQLSQVVQPQAGVQVEEWQRIGAACTVRAISAKGGDVTIPLLSYPYYRAVADDGTQLAVSRSETRQVAVSLPAGFDGSFVVSFCPPWYWRAAMVFSAAFVVLFLVWWLWGRHGRRAEPDAKVST